MQDRTYDKIEEAIKAHPFSEFGTEIDFPGEHYMAAAEKHIGVKLPPSYVWFVKKFGTGRIYGDEIFNILENDHKIDLGLDIVSQYFAFRKAEEVRANEVPILKNDFGDLFYFLVDSTVGVDGEYPVYVSRGGERRLYANNFAEFLLRQLSETKAAI